MNARTQLTLPAAVLALLGVVSAVTPPSEPEDELKAVAVLSFLRYSTWPPLSRDVLTVGVLGRPSFVQILARTLDSKSVGNRAIHVVTLTPDSDVRACQLVYLATEKGGEIRQTLAAANALHILTIGETNRFLDLGGAVNLFITDGHIGFETSMDAVERSGISISSRLLRLGQVRSRGKSGRVP